MVAKKVRGKPLVSGRNGETNMSESQATHTIIKQSPVFSTDGPVRSIVTEVIKTTDSSWAFNASSYHFGRLFSKDCMGVFSSEGEAQAAREKFIAEQLRTAGPDFFID
jgi:hypothetical protein